MFGLIKKSRYTSLCSQLEELQKAYAELHREITVMKNNPETVSLRQQLDREKGKVATLRQQCQDKEQRIASLKHLLRKKHVNLCDAYTVIPGQGRCELCSRESKDCRKLHLDGDTTVCVIPK